MLFFRCPTPWKGDFDEGLGIRVTGLGFGAFGVRVQGLGFKLSDGFLRSAARSKVPGGSRLSLLGVLLSAPKAHGNRHPFGV